MIAAFVLQTVAERQCLVEAARLVQRQSEIAKPSHVRPRAVVAPVALLADARGKKLAPDLHSFNVSGLSPQRLT